MAESAPKLALFCDEAGKDTDKFLAVGGLIVAHADINRIRNEFEQRKAKLKVAKEAKWKLTTKGCLEKHRSLVDWTFTLIRKRELLFHCILVDWVRFNHDLRLDGGRPESLKRIYYQLILHRLLKKHGKDYDCYALIDKCNELAGFERFQKGLNSVANRKHGCSEALKVIEFRDSAAEPMLQLNDLILGAICAHKNRRFEDENAGQPKANLAGFVLGRSGLLHYDDDTPKAVDDFTIWNFDSSFMRGGAVRGPSR